MARLAIRATGDRSKREHTITGDEVVHVRVYNKNTYTHTIRIAGSDDITLCTVSEHFASPFSTTIVHNSETAGRK
jgi:uncharacterized protein YqfB (UPF0267 family)